LAKLREDYDASQTQLFDALAKQEEANGVARTDDHAAALDEIDQLRRQVAGLSAQRVRLQQQVQQLSDQLQQYAEGPAQQDDDEAGEGSGVEAQSPQRQHGLLSPRSSVLGAARDAERLQARTELDSALARLRQAEHQMRLLESRANLAESQASRLQSEVQRRPAPEQYAEATAAVAALSALVGRQLEQEGWEAGAAQAAVTALAVDPGHLPAQLQERVSKLSDALATAGRTTDALRGERDAALQELQQVQSTLKEAQDAVRQLEQDLVVASACGGISRDEAAVARAGSAADSGGDLSAAILECNSQRLMGRAAASADSNDDGDRGGAAGGDGTSSSQLLSVVVRQRDRFQRRMLDLEEECGRLQQHAAELNSGSERLAADNVELVKQIRFLKTRQLAASAGAGGGAGGGGGGSSGAGATIIRVDSLGVQHVESKAARYSCGPVAFELAGRRKRQQAGQVANLASAAVGGAEARYAPHYERAVNPFADFQVR
jgi:hypothetical protein